MQYFATHYWRSGEKNTASLVLQQAYHKRKRMPVLLACIQKNGREKSAFSGEAIDWFYGKCLELCNRNGEKGIKTVERAFTDFLKQAIQEKACDNSEFEVAGILIVGKCFVMFQKGRQRIRLINTRNHCSFCRDIAIDGASVGGLCFQAGIIQKGVGILLTTDVFDENISCDMVQECLNVRELRTQEQVDKHLRELGSVAKKNEKNSLGAVLIVSH